MNIIVCGGRNFQAFHVLIWALDDILERVDGDTPITLFEGGAKGADAMAEVYAARRNLGHRKVRIDNRLDGYDSDAPRCRNIRMFHEALPGLVIGFPGGPGTRHMLDYAHKAGATVIDVEVDGDKYEVHEWPAK